jgi:hypothetical protein
LRHCVTVAPGATVTLRRKRRESAKNHSSSNIVRKPGKLYRMCGRNPSWNVNHLGPAWRAGRRTEAQRSEGNKDLKSGTTIPRMGTNTT